MSRTQHGYARGDLVVVVDCADLEGAARFWAGALGYGLGTFVIGAAWFISVEDRLGDHI